jgi:hypothetical protein
MQLIETPFWIVGDEIMIDFDNLDPKLHYGIVYQIENLLDGRLYIGKKFFWATRSKVVNGKKKKSLVESDWRKYWGSCKTLLEDVKLHGKHNFQRTILHVCSTKSQCGYFEAKEQFARDVLLDLNYYNDWISCTITRRHMQRFVFDSKKLCTDDTK